MPKVKWLGHLEESSEPMYPLVPEDHIAEMLTRAMKSRRVTYKVLAEKVLMSPASAANKKARGGNAFQLGELFKWCRALGVDGETLAETVKRAYKEAECKS